MNATAAPFIAAVIQAGGVLFDTPRTLAQLGDRAADAAASGARLAVFPEAYLGGYPKGVDFGARIGSRTPEGREWFRRYFECAVDKNGPELAQVAEIARKTGMFIVLGAIERAGHTLFCAVFTFGPDGILRGHRRKLMPTAMERLIWGFGDGAHLSAVETPWGALNAAICWENYMPALRGHFYAQGVSLYCAPTVDDREIWGPSMRMIAVEGRCFVLSACQYLRRGDAPADYHPVQGEAPETPLIRGGSVIVNPMGEILAGPVFDKEAVLSAEIDPAAIIRGKFDLDAAGHYARPDIFALRVNTRPQIPVMVDPE